MLSGLYTRVMAALRRLFVSLLFVIYIPGWAFNMNPYTLNVGSRFEQGLYFVLESEGGLSEDKVDPGAPSNYGITLNTLKKNGIDITGEGKIDYADILGLDINTAVSIYRKYYWDYLNLDAEYDWKFAIALFDCAVNVGTERTARWRDAVKDKPNKVKALNSLRTIHYLTIIKKNPALGKFKTGWLRRVNELEKYIEVLGQVE